MNMLEALLAVAVVSVGLAIVVDVLEDAATVESAVMFREDMDALRESVAQSQSMHPKDPLMGWFDLSSLSIPPGGRELEAHGRDRIRRYVVSRFGDDGLGFNPMSGEPYDVRWLDPDGTGPRQPSAFVVTTVTGPEDARLAAGSLRGRPVHLDPTIGANDPEDTTYTVRLRVLESSKAVLAQNAKGVGSDIRYRIADWDGDGTDEWGVEDIPITRPLLFAETLRIDDPAANPLTKGSECEGNQLFVTPDGEIVTCLDHDEDDDTPRQWHGARWHPDAKQEAVCSVDRHDPANPTVCDCVDGASTSDPRLCQSDDSTADRATVAADIPGWAATEHVHVCPAGTTAAYALPDDALAEATDGRAFATPVRGSPPSITYPSERGFRCLRESDECPIYREQGIWTLKTQHPADPAKDVCFVATHEDLMPTLEVVKPPASQYHSGHPPHVLGPWPRKAPPIWIQVPGQVEWVCRNSGVPLNDHRMYDPRNVTCQWVRGKELRYRSNREKYLDCDRAGNRTPVNRDVALFRTGGGNLCYGYDGHGERYNMERGLLHYTAHTRIDEKWNAAAPVAVPPVTTWAARTYSDDNDYWTVVGYKPHSAYSHLSCDPFPLSLRPGVLRGAMALGGSPLTVPLHAATWCSLLSVPPASSAADRPIAVGTGAKSCEKDREEGVDYVGYKDADGCATDATARTLKRPCATDACLKGLTIGYEDIVSVDETTGALTFDTSAMPALYPDVGGITPMWTPKERLACYDRYTGVSHCRSGITTVPIRNPPGCARYEAPPFQNMCLKSNIYANFTRKAAETLRHRDMARSSLGRTPFYKGDLRCRAKYSGSDAQTAGRDSCHQYEVRWETHRAAPTLANTDADKDRITHVIKPGKTVEPPTTVAASTAHPAPSYATRKCTLGWPRRDANECVLERQRVEAASTTNEVGDAIAADSPEKKYTDTPKASEDQCKGIAEFDSAGNREPFSTNCLATLCDSATGVMPSPRTTSTGGMVLDCAAPSTRTVHPREARPVYRGLPVGQVAASTP